MGCWCNGNLRLAEKIHILIPHPSRSGIRSPHGTMIHWHTPSTGPRPWSIGTGSCSILFTDYSWVEGREGTQAALLSLYQKHSITVTVHSYSLQPDTPICSDPSVPGTESGPDPRSWCSRLIWHETGWTLGCGWGESEEILSPSHSLAPDIWHLVIRDSGDVVRAGYWVMTPFTHHS